MRIGSRLLVVSILTTLIFSFCKKESAEPELDQNVFVDPSSTTLADQIVFTDVSPDYTLTSYHSNMSKGFDFDVDSTNDIIFYFIASNYTANNAQQTVVWTTNVKAEGNGTNNLVGNILPNSSGDPPFANLVDSGYIISNSNANNLKPFTYLHFEHSGPPGGMGTNFTGVKYLPVKVNNYFGWVKVEGFGANSNTVIKEMAINKTIGNPIKAGQKQ